MCGLAKISTTAGAPEKASPRARLNFGESHFHKLSAEKEILEIGQKLTELEEIKVRDDIIRFFQDLEPSSKKLMSEVGKIIELILVFCLLQMPLVKEVSQNLN